MATQFITKHALHLIVGKHIRINPLCKQTANDRFPVNQSPFCFCTAAIGYQYVTFHFIVIFFTSHQFRLEKDADRLLSNFLSRKITTKCLT